RPHPAVFDPPGRHQRTERVGHPVLRGRPVDEYRHPRSESLRRRMLCEQLARARAQPLNLVLVDGLDQRLASGEVPVQGADAHSGLAGGYTGARIQTRLPDSLIRRIVGVLVIAIGARYLWSGLS